MTEQPTRRTVSRLGTARALVLLAAALASGGSVLLCLGVLVFGAAVLDRPELADAALLGSAVGTLVVLVAAVTASLLAVRARTVPAVVGRGCLTLLAGVVAGLAVLLLLIAHAA